MKARPRQPLLAAGRRHDGLRATIAEVVGEFTLVPATRQGELDVYRIDATEGHGLLAERRDGRSRLRGHASSWIAREGRPGSVSLEADLGTPGASWAVTLVEPGGLPAMVAGIDPESVRLIAARFEPRLLEESDRVRAILDALTASELEEVRRLAPGSPRAALLERRLAFSRRERMDPEFARHRECVARERRRAIALQRRATNRARRRLQEIAKRGLATQLRGERVDDGEFWAAFKAHREQSSKLMALYGIDLDAMVEAAEAGRPIRLEFLPPGDDEGQPPLRRGPGD